MANEILNNVVKVSKSWILRQAMKWAAQAGQVVGGMLAGSEFITADKSADLVSKLSSSVEGLVIVGASILVGLLETYLSKRSEKEKQVAVIESKI